MLPTKSSIANSSITSSQNIGSKTGAYLGGFTGVLETPKILACIIETTSTNPL